MNALTKAKSYYSKLITNDFIQKFGFEMFRFEKCGFFAFATSLKSKRGRDITVSFNIHDDESDIVELVIQLHNKCSLEQVKTVGSIVAHKVHTDIHLYQEPDCISLVSYYDIRDTFGPINAFTTALEEINKVVMFVISQY